MTIGWKTGTGIAIACLVSFEAMLLFGDGRLLVGERYVQAVAEVRETSKTRSMMGTEGNEEDVFYDEIVIQAFVPALWECKYFTGRSIITKMFWALDLDQCQFYRSG
jgi:hypothetical protein